MQKLEIFIEENAIGSVRPVEVAADAPVSALIPALVEALKLPQTDLFGQKLIYQLRRVAGGLTIPDHATLLASGITAGEHLALASYDQASAGWQVVTGAQQQHNQNVNAALHSDVTLADADVFAPASTDTQFDQQRPPEKQKGKWTRRAFLMVGGVALGAAGAGIGYAAYHTLLNKNAMQASQVKIQPPPATHTQPAPAQHLLPTTAKVQTVFTGHQQLVRSVMWSPDGMNLASGGDDKQLFIWDTNGNVRLNIQHPAGVRGVAWSPDGQRFVTGAGTQVAFFSVQNGQRLAHSTHHHTQMITSVAWAGQGQAQVVTGSLDKRAIIWNTTNYHAQTVYTLHNAPIEAVAWAADGVTVATSSQGGYVRIWAATSGQDVQPHYQDANAPMRAIAFSPTGKQLAVGGDDGVMRLWNAGMCQNVVGQDMMAYCADMPTRLQVSHTAIRAVAWSHNGRLLAVGTDDGVISIWSTVNLQKPLLTIQQNASVHSITWSPDDKHLAGAAQNAVTLWALM